MSKHAPGPWKRTHGPGRFYIKADEKHLATVFYRGGEFSSPSFPELEQASFNARIITAAPELLAQLENLCRLSVWNGASDYDRAQVEAARAAIAKATGG